LKQQGTDVKAVGRNGLTAFHNATQLDDVDAVRLLIDFVDHDVESLDRVPNAGLMDSADLLLDASAMSGSQHVNPTLPGNGKYAILEPLDHRGTPPTVRSAIRAKLRFGNKKDCVSFSTVELIGSVCSSP
jgi:hypothetical protein